ncbi:hypothetical protein Sru01_04880 [Sphaerisporangium rufum]|uniref:Enoyl reductase n=1 Tax=Sphaerisporangium rufum TaxID=1381558 RepID=A0A919UVY2_9ACTN|nr:hypothetical protein [Sphaerisporangium rufum]GII75506.1 hypothetical protein Sru01_04880 [Sphaerisporangium rufum]
MRRLLTVLALSATLAAALALPAAAQPPGGGSGDGKNFSVYVKNLVRLSGSGYKGGSPNLPVDFDPPHCWYQPQYTYEEMRDWAERIRFVWHHEGPEGQRESRDWYEQILAEIAPHAGEPGKIFWFLTDDGTDAGWDCYMSTDPFWKYVGAQPPAVANDKIIDPVDLALIARANLTLPDPVITLNPPRGRSFVGLETWVGVQDQGERDVTAEVAGTNLSATIVARPSRVDISVHGADAEVHDGLARCPEYRKGADLGGACWVRFNRSSLGAPYRITVTQTWVVTTNVAGVTLPPGEVSAGTTVIIDEIQSNVTR